VAEAMSPEQIRAFLLRGWRTDKLAVAMKDGRPSARDADLVRARWRRPGAA
jgi:hypothetical protein